MIALAAVDKNIAVIVEELRSAFPLAQGTDGERLRLWVERVEGLLDKGDPIEMAAIGAALNTFEMAENDSLQNKRPLRDHEIKRLMETIKGLSV